MEWMEMASHELNFIYDMPNPIIFTHGDVDGLCAAALLMRAFERREIDCQVVITQPFSLQNDLIRYDETYNFIVLDLAISGKTKDLLLPGSVVIDHHPATKEYEKGLKAKGVFVNVDIRKSASQLIFKLVGGGKHNRYISRLGAAGDWIINNKDLGKQSTLLASSMAWIPDDDWMRFYILGALIEGKTVWQMKEASKRSKLAFQKLDRIRKSYLQLYEDENFSMRYYEEGFGFASILANKLYKETNKIAFALCLIDKRAPDLLVTGRSPDFINFDLRKVYKEFYRWKGYGGGHKKAASGVLPKEKLFDFFTFLSKMKVSSKGTERRQK
jgi:single-stranded DNA-specific DHH superfamily exonuclease